MILRWKRMPPEPEGPFAAFREVLELVGRAKSPLTGVMPTTRLPGTPLAEAIHEFETLLADARERMPEWRVPAVEDAWVSVSAAIEASLERARRLREEAPELGGFERLIGAVGQLLDPLDDALEVAGERFRDLRTRSL